MQTVNADQLHVIQIKEDFARHLLIRVRKLHLALQLTEVLQMQMIVCAARLIAIHCLGSFVQNNLTPTCAQIKPLTWVILLVILVVIGVTLKQYRQLQIQYSNIHYDVERHVK